MPHYLVDLYRTRDPFSGLGRFCHDLGEALLAQARADEHFTFLVPRGYRPASLSGASFVDDNFLLRHFPTLHQRYDVWHSTYQLRSHAPKPGVPNLLTVHDLNFLVEKDERRAAGYLRQLQREVDGAAVLTAISNATRDTLVQHVRTGGKPVHVIHNGVKMPAGAKAERPAVVGNDPYLLCVSVFKEKKDLHTLLPMLQHVPAHRLVLVGDNATAYGQRIKELIAREGLDQRVVLTGTVDEATKWALYQHCAAFVLPSSAEGFGIPPVEAMLAGKPVVVNGISSLREVGGAAAGYFTDADPAHMAAVVREQLSAFHADPSLSERNQRHAARFSWASCAESYLRLYRQC